MTESIFLTGWAVVTGGAVVHALLWRRRAEPVLLASYRLALCAAIPGAALLLQTSYYLFVVMILEKKTVAAAYDWPTTLIAMLWVPIGAICVAVSLFKRPWRKVSLRFNLVHASLAVAWASSSLVALHFASGV
jgi:hypothetical protein